MVALTLAAYLAALLAIGAAARGRAQGDEGFFLGGRRVGPWVAAVGASASSSSAWTLLGVSGAAYAWGLSAAWLVPGCVGGFVLNWAVFAPRLSAHGRRTGAMTALEAALGPDAGPGARRLAATIVLVSLGAYVASQLQGAGKTFEAVFALPPWQTIPVGAAVVLAYTWLGGFPSVSATDAVQGTVMAATAVALPTAALVAAGGPVALAGTLAADAPDGYLSPGGPRAAPLAAGFALGLLGIGLGYPGQPHVAKYFLALSDDPGAVRRARAVAVAWALVVYTGMVTLGLAARAIVPDLADGEVAFVAAARALFPPAVAGVMLAAVLSAMMSTADSQLFVAATTLTHDLGLGGARRVAATRVGLGALMVAAAATALVGDASIFSRVLFGWAAMGASLGPLLLVRVVLRRRLRPGAAVATLATGAGLAAAAHALYADTPLPPALRGVAVHVVPYLAAGAVAWRGSAPAAR